jgi:hypothetical protein
MVVEVAHEVLREDQEHAAFGAEASNANRMPFASTNSAWAVSCI